MKAIVILALLAVVFISCPVQGNDEPKKVAKKQLQIGIKKKIENCSRTSKKGDSLSMHYTGKLGTDFFNIIKCLFKFKPSAFIL